MNPLQEVEWLEPLVEPRSDPELEHWVKKEGGSPYPHTPYFADCPWIYGERTEITALFADLVGFTALSERLEPAMLVRVLNAGG